jgi:leucyl/phenylalanyl-tRNA--protein transferase
MKSINKRHITRMTVSWQVYAPLQLESVSICRFNSSGRSSDRVQGVDPFHWEACRRVCRKRGGGARLARSPFPRSPIHGTSQSMGERHSIRTSKITIDQILFGYQSGYFPMARGLEGKIEWFIAEPRTILPLDERFRVRRSLRQTQRRLSYEIRLNTAFAEVIRACARHAQVDPREVWLSEEMIALYTELHQRRLAHSVEVWTPEGLVGGLYGVSFRAAFFGESMFSRTPSASQIALIALVERLRDRRFQLLDVQMRTPHIGHFGAIDLPHAAYLDQLGIALNADATFEGPDPSPPSPSPP